MKKVLSVLPFLACVACFTNPAGAAQQVFKSNLAQCNYNIGSLRTVAQWESLFLGTWNTENERIYLPMSLSLDSWQFYNLAYAIDANTSMYEATGKRQYLDRALLYVTNVINNAKPSSSLPSQFHDSYLGWVSQREDTKNQEVPLFESYMWRYVTRMLRVMDETNISNDPAYAARYQSILAFSERNIFDKWTSRGANSYIYRSRTHMASHWAYIASNLWLLTSDPARRAKYKEVYDNVNYHLPNYDNSNGTPASLHGQMKVRMVGGFSSYFYSDEWGVMSGHGSDYSHGGNTIAYIVDAHQTGIGGWTQTDMDNLIVTLDKVLWRGPGSYAAYLDGSGTGAGWWNEGWVKLGRYCPSLQKRLESHTVARNIQFNANGALNMMFINRANGQPGKVNGVCGPSNGVAVTEPPATGLCAAGIALLPVNGTGPWTWSCGGISGGTTASCSAPKRVQPPVGVPGQCGLSNGVAVSVKPATDLCAAGTASVVGGTGPWTWSCSGINGGPAANCSAPKGAQPPVGVPGQCGPSNGKTFSSVPLSGKCVGGGSNLLNLQTTTSGWTWQCKGDAGAPVVSCSATKTGSGNGGNSGGTTLRIETGGGKDVSAGGVVWKADSGFIGGHAIDRSYMQVDIANTTLDPIYLSEREDASGYALPVTNGSYTVKLHFAENSWTVTKAGQRVFTVRVENTSLGDVDIFAQAPGKSRALVKTVSVTVSDGKLDIAFARKAGSAQLPVISAIEVLPN